MSQSINLNLDKSQFNYSFASEEQLNTTAAAVDSTNEVGITFPVTDYQCHTQSLNCGG